MGQAQCKEEPCCQSAVKHLFFDAAHEGPEHAAVHLFGKKAAELAHRTRSLSASIGGHSLVTNEVISEGIRGLPELTYLSLHARYHASPEEISAMAEGIKDLQHLDTLVLFMGNCGINEAGAQVLGDMLHVLQDLNKIDLNLLNNVLGDAGASVLFRSLAGHPNLVHLKLNVSTNLTTDKSVPDLMESLALLPHLTKLKLFMTGNEIGDHGVIYFANSMRTGRIHLHKLELHLGSCSVQNEGIATLGESFKLQDNLETFKLHLEDNNLGTDSFKSLQVLFEGLQDLPKLELLLLNLHNTSISDEGVAAIAGSTKNLPGKPPKQSPRGKLPGGLRSLKGLTSLSLELGQNGISEKGGFTLAEGLQHMTNLKQLKLELRDNKLRNSGALEISKSVSKLKALKDLALDLQDNRLTLDGDTEVANCLKSKNELDTLTLDLNGHEVVSPDGTPSPTNKSPLATPQSLHKFPGMDSAERK